MELHYSIYLFFLISLFNPIFTLSLRSSLSPRHQNLSPSLLARDNRITATPSTPTRKILTKRDWRTMRNVFAAVQYIGNGWSLHFRSLDICHTNVDFAASELLDFYNQVLAAALPAWSRQPPATAHGATLGDVSIHFRSDVPIPWDFIHSYLLAAVCLFILPYSSLLDVAGLVADGVGRSGRCVRRLGILSWRAIRLRLLA